MISASCIMLCRILTDFAAWINECCNKKYKYAVLVSQTNNIQIRGVDANVRLKCELYARI